MNLAVWAPPALALVASVVWIGSRKVEVKMVASQILLLEEKVAKAEARSEVAAGANRRSGALGHEGAIDWKEVAGWMGSVESGKMDMRAMMELQQVLLEMDADALLAALDEVSALELGGKLKVRLETMLIGQLVEVDAVLALRRFSDRIHNRDGRDLS